MDVLTHAFLMTSECGFSDLITKPKKKKHDLFRFEELFMSGAQQDSAGQRRFEIQGESSDITSERD